jgi:hypothetical protein
MRDTLFLYWFSFTFCVVARSGPSQTKNLAPTNWYDRHDTWHAHAVTGRKSREELHKRSVMYPRFVLTLFSAIHRQKNIQHGLEPKAHHQYRVTVTSRPNADKSLSQETGRRALNLECSFAICGGRNWPTSCSSGQSIKRWPKRSFYLEDFGFGRRQLQLEPLKHDTFSTYTCMTKYEAGMQ